MTNRKKNGTSWTLMLFALPLLLAADGARADIATYVAELAGANEVPPTITSATGMATLIVDTETLDATWTVQFSGLTSPQTGAHIHNAPAGANGGVVFPLPVGSPVNGVWAMSPAQYADLAAELYYVNVHTEVYAGGEIRGQLVLTGTIGDEHTTFGAVKALFRR